MAPSPIPVESLFRVAEDHRLHGPFADRAERLHPAREHEAVGRRSVKTGRRVAGSLESADLARVFTMTFPYDEIEPVSKGVRGADIIQKVQNQARQNCGTIIWEAKTAKHLW